VVIRPTDVGGTVELNGESLGPFSPATAQTRFEVTDRLAVHNKLAILLRLTLSSGPAAEENPPCAVSLEIESS
jgi:hypothetical protein